MTTSRKKLLLAAVATVFLFFVADSVLARGGRGGGGRGGGGGGRGGGFSRPSSGGGGGFSRNSGGSHHSIRNSGSYGGSYNRGRYDRPSTGRPGNRPGDRPGDRPGNWPGDRPGNRPGDRPPIKPGDRYDDWNDGSWHSQAHKDARNLQQQRYQYAEQIRDERREWVEDNWYYGRGAYAGVRVYYNVPCSYTVTVVNGHSYYQCGSVWYDRVYNDGQVTYIVVNRP